jgi:hypothetical protein
MKQFNAALAIALKDYKVHHDQSKVDAACKNFWSFMTDDDLDEIQKYVDFCQILYIKTEGQAALEVHFYIVVLFL